MKKQSSIVMVPIMGVGTVPRTVIEYSCAPDKEIAFKTFRALGSNAPVVVLERGFPTLIGEGEAVYVPTTTGSRQDVIRDCGQAAYSEYKDEPFYIHVVKKGDKYAVMAYRLECDPLGDWPEDESTDGLISIDDFFKAKMLTATVIKAEPHPNADKLLVLQVQVGDKTKQIVAGIRKHYSPMPTGGLAPGEDSATHMPSILGKTIIIVDNLKPTKLRGVDSAGMLLAVRTPDGGLRLITTDGPAPSGLEVG